jgi:hypothetical protein
MVRRSHDIRRRVFGAVLGAFMIGIQLLLSAGHRPGVAAADQADMLVVCSHDPSGAANGPAAVRPRAGRTANARPARARCRPAAGAAAGVAQHRSAAPALGGAAVQCMVPSELQRHSPYASRSAVVA